MKVRLRIYYTDGEVVDKHFEMLQEALDYIKAEIVEKREFADRIIISID